MQDAHVHEVADVLKTFNSDPVRGLDAVQRQRNLRMYGPNQLPSPPPKPFLSLVLKQFEDLLVMVLLLAGFVSFLIAVMEGASGIASFVEPIVILLILIANAAVGVWQETSAEAAIASLKELEAQTAKVVIDGELHQIPSVNVVPGDIVHIGTGDMVPADIRLISISSKVLSIDESSLTGESDAVAKSTAAISIPDLVDQDKLNTAFSSTLVTRGHAVGVAVLTGSATSIGRIQAGIVSAEDETTPLQAKLHEFGQLLSKMIGIICVLIWVVNIGHFLDPEFGGLLGGAVHFFKMAVALAVAAIPEGLPAVVTTCLALGTRQLASKHAIIRRLASIETLGCTSVICSDKTGTLTSNEMTVSAVMVLKSDPKSDSVEAEMFRVTGSGWSPHGQLISSTTGTPVRAQASSNFGLREIGRVGALCNQSVINFNPVKRTYSKVGESTEAALRVLSEKIGLPEGSTSSKSLVHNGVSSYWREQHPIDSFLDFDRDRKSMSVVVNDSITPPSSKTLLTKGAPESILDRCSTALLSSGAAVLITDDLRALIEKHLSLYSSEGMRCLAMASKPLPSSFDIGNCSDYVAVEQDMCFVGIVAMLDPPRPDVADAIRRCRTAGIRIIVVTGDNIITAKSICMKIGIFNSKEESDSKCVTGAQFNAMTPAEQSLCVLNCRLFARVEPSHKQRLVELLRVQGHVVAMTGDGVNDAPALRRADIGIAMGSGTAVAREACDMVLQSDDFATIVDAVEQGRSIFNNTRAFIRYLISSNIGEVVCVFMVSALGIPEALIPVQLLWVNLVTDGPPAIALGFNPPDPEAMRRQPRSRSEPIVSSWHLFRFIVVGVYVGLATVFGFIWWFTMSPFGPRVSFSQLRSFHLCSSRPDLFQGVDCSVFHDPRGPTFALSILVLIEMFNALNALSQDQSLLSVTPLSNLYVLGAIVFSVTLHLAILYTPFLASVFSVAPLSMREWGYVVLFSLPVIFVDEILKLSSRYQDSLCSLSSRWASFRGRTRRYRRFSDAEVLTELCNDSDNTVAKWA